MQNKYYLNSNNLLINKWLFINILFSIFILCPIIFLITNSFANTLDVWIHLKNTKLFLYIYNTIILVFGVGILSTFLGVSSAWLTTQYNFIFKKYIEWLLILPLAIPGYIVAYAYTDFLEYSGAFQTFIRSLFGFSNPSEYYFPSIRSLGGAIFILSFSLYPYVYLLVKFAFNTTPKNLIETSILNQKNPFYNVILPLSRPAIIAGSALVIMETISDFGTVDYFAVETLTLAMFNLWLGMNNLEAASQISLIIFSFVIFILSIELINRRNKRFDSNVISNKYEFSKKISRSQKLLILFLCLIPIIIGFIIPVLILLNLTLSNFDFDELLYSLIITKNSFLIGFLGGASIVISSLYFCLYKLYDNSRVSNVLLPILGSGYAFPGVVIALGTLFFLGNLQFQINSFLDFFEFNLNFSFIGGFFGLILALTVRFNSIGLGSINTGLSRIPKNLIEANLTLGQSFVHGTKKILLPLLKSSILIGFILTFIDIIKELPITLLLRPFNFETLTTHIYQYASDEMLEKAALPSLIIIIASLLPVFIIYKTFIKK